MNAIDIIAVADTDKIIDLVKGETVIEVEPQTLQETYDGKHKILERADKNKLDDNGNIVGSTPTAKLVLNYQKKIVENAVAFLMGSPISIVKKTEGGDEAFQYLLDALDDCKFHSQNKELARKLFTQRRSAKLYYIKNPEDLLNRKLGSMVLSYENGSFYPNFNDTNDLDLFLRVYERTVLIDGKKQVVPVYELYTAEQIKTGQKLGGAWVEVQNANLYTKIPVVYYTQPKEEWYDADTLIGKQELSLSELADTNQYFGSPMAVATGNVTGAPNKDDQGKMVICEYVKDPATGQMMESKLNYLTWDQRPESIKMQFDLIDKFIYSFSQTADISFLTMIQASLGNISGVALKLLLLDPLSKAMVKQELFEKNLQRELSVIKSILGTMEAGYASDYELMKFDIQFNSILPENIGEVIAYLTAARPGEPIISQESSVNLNPAIKNKQKEIDILAAEKTGDSAISNGSFNL
jgi:SPP1 family phage portal protein